MAKSTNDLANTLSPLLESRGLDLVDVELHGSELTVFVDRQGGVDLDTLGDATRAVSAMCSNFFKDSNASDSASSAADTSRVRAARKATSLP